MSDRPATTLLRSPLFHHAPCEVCGGFCDPPCKTTYNISGPYKIRKGASGPSREARTKSVQYEITVPQDIAELVLTRHFSCEMTDEGILFRPVEQQIPRRAPKWVSS